MKGAAPSGQGLWEPLSTPWGEVNSGNKKGGSGQGGSPCSPSQEQGRCLPSQIPWERGKRQLYTAQTSKRSRGRKQPLCATGEWGQGVSLPGHCALPRPPPVLGEEGVGSLPCPIVLRGNKILSNQKVILRPFPARTSIKVPRRIVRRL